MEHPWKKEGPYSASAINRGWKAPLTVAVRASLALATVVDCRGAAGGCVVVPTGGSSTTLTFWAHTDEDETFLPLYDRNNDAVTLTVAGGTVHPLPDEVYNVPFFKMVSNANEDVYVFLKG